MPGSRVAAESERHLLQQSDDLTRPGQNEKANTTSDERHSYTALERRRLTWCRLACGLLPAFPRSAHPVLVDRSPKATDTACPKSVARVPQSFCVMQRSSSARQGLVQLVASQTGAVQSPPGPIVSLSVTMSHSLTIRRPELPDQVVYSPLHPRLAVLAQRRGAQHVAALLAAGLDDLAPLERPHTRAEARCALAVPARHAQGELDTARLAIHPRPGAAAQAAWTPRGTKTGCSQKGAVPLTSVIHVQDSAAARW